MKNLFPNDKWFLLFVLAAGAFLGLLSPGCANVIPPTGGPRDSLPPNLLGASPENGTLFFNEKRIVLEFDEYVRLGNQNPNDIIINPPQQRPAGITANLRNVTIRINDTLQPNTTYQIQFGNNIQDVNENNPYPNFTYVFSTGSYLDSLMLNGVIYNAQTGEPDSTMTVMLYRSDEDSAVAKHNPDFVTMPNNRGMFQFNYLPPGIYSVYAIKNEGFLRYTSPVSPLAYHTERVEVAAGTTPFVELRYFVAEPEVATTPTTQPDPDEPEEKIFRARIAASRNQKQDLLKPLQIVFNRPVGSFDSTRLVFRDTLGNPMEYTRIEQDTVNLATLNLYAPWQEKTVYDIILREEFARDTLGVHNAIPDTARFETRAQSEYGQVRFIFTGLEAYQQPVLQLVQNNQVVNSVPLTSNRIEIERFQPGNYTMRLLEDLNGNGRWDPGDLWRRIQPEYVVPIPGTLNVRANWENEFEINL